MPGRLQPGGLIKRNRFQVLEVPEMIRTLKSMTSGTVLIHGHCMWIIDTVAYGVAGLELPGRPNFTENQGKKANQLKVRFRRILLYQYKTAKVCAYVLYI